MSTECSGQDRQYKQRVKMGYQGQHGCEEGRRVCRMHLRVVLSAVARA